MKKVTKWHILFIGLVFVLIAGLFLWWGFCFTNTKFDKILTSIAAVLSLFLSSIFFYMFALSFGKQINVFLYEKKTKREIAVEDLTFERICEFLDLYMGIVFSDIKYIPFSGSSKHDYLEYVPREYYPLIVMRLLSIWMESGTDEQCKLLAETDKSNVDAIVDILFNCGERIISSKLVYLRASYTGDDTEIKEFCLNHLEYFKEFMLNYVNCNIRTFD